jgi:hypothetical protein
MSRNSFSNTVADWESLLSAVEANQSEIPNVDAYAAQLAAAVADLKEMRALRAALQSEARELTQSLLGRSAQAKDLAIRLRSWIRGWYGAHNEKLMEFGVKPIRKRGPRGRPAAAGTKDEAPRYPTSTVR